MLMHFQQVTGWSRHSYLSQQSVIDRDVLVEGRWRIIIPAVVVRAWLVYSDSGVTSSQLVIINHETCTVSQQMLHSYIILNM